MAVEIRIVGRDDSGGALRNAADDVREVGRAAGEAKGATGGFFSGLFSNATNILSSVTLVTGAIQGIGGAMTGLVEGNRQFEQYETQFKVLLGTTEAAKERIAELTTFAAKTPFELPGVVESDRILQGFGLHSEEAARKFGYSGSQILTIAGDVASGTGSNFQEMATLIGKFSSGATGEAISRMQELGITNRDELSKMGLEFSKAGQLMSPVPEAMQVVLDLMKQKYGGMMDAQSQTFDGMLSNLQDWMGGTIRTVSAPIFDALKVQLGNLLAFLPLLQPYIEGFAQVLAGALSQAITFILGLVTQLQPALAAMGAAWAAMLPTLTLVGTFLQDNLQPILAGVGAILAVAIVPALAGAAAAFAAAIAAALPIIAVLAAIAAAGAMLQQAWASDFGGIQELTAGAMDAIQAVIGQVLGVVSAFWQAHGAEIVAFAQQAWTQIQTIVGTVAEIVATVVKTVFGAIAGFLKEHGTTIQAILTYAWDTIRNVISTALNLIQGITSTVLAVLRGDWQGAADGIKGIVGTMVEAVTTQFDNLKTLISRIGPGLLDAAKSVGSAILDGVANGIADGVGALVDAVKDAAHSALDAAKKALGIKSPSSVFAAAVGLPIAQGIAQGIRQGAPLVAGTAAGVAGAAVAGAQTTVNVGGMTINQSSGQRIDQLAHATVDYLRQMADMRR